MERCPNISPPFADHRDGLAPSGWPVPGVLNRDGCSSVASKICKGKVTNPEFPEGVTCDR
jgi:hypothetical protein